MNVHYSMHTCVYLQAASWRDSHRGIASALEPACTPVPSSYTCLTQQNDPGSSCLEPLAQCPGTKWFQSVLRNLCSCLTGRDCASLRDGTHACHMVASHSTCCTTTHGCSQSAPCRRAVQRISAGKRVHHRWSSALSWRLRRIHSQRLQSLQQCRPSFTTHAHAAVSAGSAAASSGVSFAFAASTLYCVPFFVLVRFAIDFWAVIHVQL